MGGVILVSEGVGCNFWPREGCKNEVPAMGTPLLPPLCPPVDTMYFVEGLKKIQKLQNTLQMCNACLCMQ